MGIFDISPGGLFGSNREYGPSEFEGAFGQDLEETIRSRFVDPTSGPEFEMLAAAIQEQASMQASGGESQIGKAGVAGGFFDSGAMLEGLAAIESGAVTGTAGSLASTLGALAQEGTANALPFLAAQEQASINAYRAELGADLATATSLEQITAAGSRLGKTIGGMGAGEGSDILGDILKDEGGGGQLMW